MRNYQKIFQDFATPYLDEASDKEKGDFELKFKHSFDLLENCCKICESLSIEGIEAHTYQIAALFHDTGRFPQFKKYGTFKDADSCNHATTGVRYILRKRLLDGLESKRLKTVLAAIALHNRKILPPNLSQEMRTATLIVRDSDKMDILKVLLDHMTDTRPESSVALMGLKDIPELISEPVLRSIEAGEQANYLEMKSVNDFRLLVLSWAYDLNYRWSRQQMIALGYADKLFDQLPRYKRITDLYDPIMEQLNS